MKPKSIRLFQSLWSAMLLFMLANMALTWGVTQRAMASRLPGQNAGAMLAIANGLGFLIPLLVLVFVLRRSNIARGVAVLLSAYNGWILASALLPGRLPAGFIAVLGIVCVALEIGATAMLFRADARAWFAKPVLDNSTEA